MNSDMHERPTGDNLVFAGGAPRSGLTLLRAIAHAHPEIFCGPDSGVLPGLALQRRDFRKTLGALHEGSLDLPPSKVDENFAVAITQILTAPLTDASASLALEKTPLNILAFTDLAEIFPAARFIHVVRDGRDVAASLMERDWRDPRTGKLFDHVRSLHAAAHYWRGLVEIGLRAQHGLNNPARFFVLRYEDLVRAPAPTLRALCEFLHVKPDTAMRRFYQQPIELIGIEKESAERLAKPLGDDRTGRWRYKFSGDEVEAIQSIAGPHLRALGYL